MGIRTLSKTRNKLFSFFTLHLNILNAKKLFAKNKLFAFCLKYKQKSPYNRMAKYLCPVNAHDLGGSDLDLKIDLTEKRFEYWERAVHATMVLLVSKGYLTVDEMRRSIEGLPAETYNSWGYYQKWAAGIAVILIERGIFTQKEWDQALGRGSKNNNTSGTPKFSVGEEVKVLHHSQDALIQRPHLRTPGYVHGCSGIIERYCGEFEDPEVLAFRGNSKKQHLYRVRFITSVLWPRVPVPCTDTDSTDNKVVDNDNDTVDVEIYEAWLAHASEVTYEEHRQQTPLSHAVTHKHSHLHGHHTHDHGDHTHEERSTVEENACNAEPVDDLGRRVAEKLVSELQRKNILNPESIAQGIETVDNLGTKYEGPRIIVKAWTDHEFKARLLTDANAALEEIGIAGSNSTASTVLTAVENTATVHNVIVCTLCSCYPLSILGLAPPWYKSRAYRARVVREPRTVLVEFGTIIDRTINLRVHDSTADLRYIVIPQRPEGTDGFSDEELMKLVTRDSIIGVRHALKP
jgi:nitrile hydratase subunit alpha